LALAASTFRPPIVPNIKYQVEIRHRKTIPDNIKNWKLFSDDIELQIFLHTIEVLKLGGQLSTYKEEKWGDIVNTRICILFLNNQTEIEVYSQDNYGVNHVALCP
jgi:hypothetical protein